MYTALYPILRLSWSGGYEMRRYQRVLERTQWLSRAELEESQLRKMRDLLRHAYENVPFYRSLYQTQGIRPDDINSFKDFQALPVLTKQDVNDHLEDLVSTGYSGKRYLSHTGGSTGEPLHFYTDRSSPLWGGALLVRSRKWYGVKPGDKIGWVWGAQMDMPDQNRLKRLKAVLTRNRYLNAFSMTEDKMKAFAERLVLWKPAMIRAYPSALCLFADYVQSNGIKGIRPALIETTSEKLMDYQRHLLEMVFQCPVAECYSSREIYEMAYQCPSGGLHTTETVYLEILTGDRAAQDGQTGEVIVTSLNKFAMPFIRYKIDDLAAWRASCCSCGRELPCLQEITGRKNDYIVTSSGQMVDGRFFNSIFRHRPEVLRFQVCQKDLHHLEIRLIFKKRPDTPWLQKIRKELRDRLGSEMETTLTPVDHIPLTAAGKHHYVRSDINRTLDKNRVPENAGNRNKLTR